MENRVSIWIGTFENRELLNNFIQERYTEDGDLESDFMLEFGIDYIDNQFQEVDFYNDLTEKQDIFKSFSYIESYIDDIPDQNWNEYNIVICLYNFDYTADVLNTGDILFIGAHDYLAD